MKYAILTFGCRVNQADSFDLEAVLRARHGEASEPEEADLVVVNSCTVTAAADQDARRAVRRLARVNPRARILATGCYVTREPDALAGLPGVIRLLPNAEKAAFEAVVDAELADGRLPSDVEACREGPCGTVLRPGSLGRTAVTLRVQSGCDEHCSYCIVPFTRGPARSRPVPDVLRELDGLTAAGYAEVVITGVHLGSYGRDLVPASSLAELLSRLAARATRSGGPLLRISSIEPMDCGEDVLDALAASGAFAHHLHLPLQHASDRVLRAMRRPYSQGDFSRALEGIRMRMPGAAIGSDVIVGFPGESGTDFDVLAAYLEASTLTHLHVFPYSERPGTEAASLGPKVPSTVIARRAERLRATSRTLHARFAASQVGAVRPGLVLRSGTRVMTDNYLTVSITPARPRNERVRVRLVSAHPLRGEVMR